MVTLLFADDDILALNRLTTLLDWNAYGYEIIGQTSNGIECLQKVKELDPDILILDIDMPGKNGVEVVREMKQWRKMPYILVLSNYDNFDFVRDVMRYGAFDYVIKHQIDAGKMITKLQEIEKSLEKDNKDTKRLTYFTTIAKQQYLKKLIEHGITDTIEHQHMLSQKDYGSQYHVLVAMQITNFILTTHFSHASNREKLIDSILSLASNIFTSLENGLITYMEYGQFAILFHFEKENSDKKILEMVYQYMRILVSNIQKILNISVLYQVSDILTKIDCTSRYYQETIKLLEQQSFVSTEKVSNLVPKVIDIREEKELMEALTSLDVIKTRSVLQSIFKKYTHTGSMLSQQIIFQLLQLGIRFQKSNQIELEENVHHELQQLSIQQRNNEEVSDIIFQYYEKLITTALQYMNKNYSEHVAKVIVCIRQQYNQEISLISLAEQIHISPTHLSRLFHKETGSSLVDYITSFRIQVARQLIRNSDMDLKHIAEHVGFHSYNYFLRVYKEKVGHTPSQEL